MSRHGHGHAVSVQNVNTPTRTHTQTRASRRTRSGTVADSEEERSALPTVGTWPAIEAGHRDSLLYSGGKNPRDSAATQASGARDSRTSHAITPGTQLPPSKHTHTAPSSPKLPGGSPAPQSVVALHSMRSDTRTFPSSPHSRSRPGARSSCIVGSQAVPPSRPRGEAVA